MVPIAKDEGAFKAGASQELSIETSDGPRVSKLGLSTHK